MKSLLKFGACTIAFVGMMLPAKAQLTNVNDLKKNLSIEQKDTVAWLKNAQLSCGAIQGFLHNWQAGGELLSLQFNALFTGDLTYINHNRIWSNYLLMGYGLNYQYSTNFVPKKVDDRIDFTTKYGIRSDRYKNWYLTGLLNFRTQFTEGYDYNIDNWKDNPTSRFFAPAYLTAAIGLEYRQDKFSLFFTPFAGKATFANAEFTSIFQEGAFGIEYGKTARFELGAYMSARWETDITKNLSYRTRLDLYSNYLAKDRTLADGSIRKDNPGNIDILFENNFGLKVGKIFTVMLGAVVIYDNDMPYQKFYFDDNNVMVEKSELGNDMGWAQISQVLNVGVTIKL